MVDIVTNHMGYAGCGECVDYSKFSPFNNESYYHPFCLIDYNNKTSMKIVSVLSFIALTMSAHTKTSAGRVTIPCHCLISELRTPQ
jgi:hypothetical protein